MKDKLISKKKDKYLFLLLHQMPQLRVVGDAFLFTFNDFNDI